MLPLQNAPSQPPPAAVRERATERATERAKERTKERTKERAMVDQCCSGDLGYLLLQINVICLLLALIGTAVIVRHHDWFGGGVPVIAQSLTER